MKRKVTLKQTLHLFLFFFVGSFLLLITFYSREINQIIVGGPLYNQIIQSKELIADVLPPPLFAIESFTNDIEMVQEMDANKRIFLYEQSKEMEQAYEKKLISWKEKYSSDSHIIRLLEDSAGVAHELFRVQNEELIPLLQRNEIKQALILTQGKLKRVYQIHRGQVEKIVELASENNRVIERNSKKIIKKVFTTLFIFSGLFLVVLLLLFFWIIRMENQSRAISEQNLELKKAQNDLVLKSQELILANKELESFSYTVSHDLRAPLRGINGWTTILLEDYAEKLDSQARDYLGKVVSESIRMGDLIDDLLKLAHISRAELSISEINLTKLVKQLSERIIEKNSGRKIIFQVQEDLTINGDLHLIEIAMTNLISNAVKFTSKQENTLIEFGKKLSNGEEVFFIKDNGVGFNKTNASNLFKPFCRMHKQEEFPGTGIGLATVKKIFELHHGKIWAESEQGQGSTFYFTFQNSFIEP
jgi:signal transduction histidine kinase